MKKIIKRNTPYPAEVVRIGQTKEDNRKVMCIHIFEGEHTNPKFNKFLGEVLLSGIVLSKKGATKADIVSKINRQGELSVNATDTKTKSSTSIRIVRPKLFTEKINKMKEELKFAWALQVDRHILPNYRPTKLKKKLEK